MPKMTFAIPCYNMEPWLPVCIESCLYQTEPDVEVLVVNDGSTDDSGSVGRPLCGAGLPACGSSTRPTKGTARRGRWPRDNATGDFVHFLDADDFLDKNAVRDLYGTAMRDNVDAVCGNAVVFSNKTFNSRQYFYRSPAAQPDLRRPRLLGSPRSPGAGSSAGTCSCTTASSIRPTSPARTSVSCSMC